MEKVISLLFDIERKANSILERANAEKVALSEETEAAIATMEKEIANDNSAKIEALLIQADQEIEQEKLHLIEDSNKQLQDLEADFTKNHDDLVEKLFRSIIQI